MSGVHVHCAMVHYAHHHRGQFTKIKIAVNLFIGAVVEYILSVTFSKSDECIEVCVLH